LGATAGAKKKKWMIAALFLVFSYNQPHLLPSFFDATVSAPPTNNLLNLKNIIGSQLQLCNCFFLILQLYLTSIPREVAGNGNENENESCQRRECVVSNDEIGGVFF
jgi:hypothetical protein